MTGLRVCPLDDRADRAWDALVDTSPQGTFYHGRLWLGLVARHIPGQQLERWGCFSEKRLIGGCTLLGRRRMGLRIAEKPWATHYAGVLLDPAAGAPDEDVVGALRAGLERRFDVIQLVHGPGFAAVEPFRRAAWRIAERRTLVVEGGGESRLWQTISSRARNTVRRAEREGLHVRDQGDVAVFSHVYWRSYERQAIAIPFARRQFEQVCAGVLGATCGRLWTAHDGAGEPCAGVLFAWHRERAYALFAGSDRSRSMNGAGSLVWWHALRELAPRFRELDLVGEGTEGIRRFKAQFNPRAVAFPQTGAFRSPLHRAAWSLAGAARRLRASASRLRAGLAKERHASRGRSRV